MKNALLLAALLAANAVSAQVFYQDDFTGASINTSVWTTESGSPVTLDDPNDQLDYDHTAGTTRRFINYNPGFTVQTGYLKAEISNFTGSPSIWIAFVGSNPGNNISRHSGATRFVVDVTADAKSLRMVIEDNGCGFDASKPPPSLLRRARMLRAPLEVHSPPPGGPAGTRVVLTLKKRLLNLRYPFRP